ncbi:MAG: CBS domain-containing protein, partial [Pseudomonadota bacterium]
MSDERNGSEERGLFGRIAQAFSSEPRSRDDLREVLKLAAENDIIDDDALSIIEGAMEVGDMQARDIMVPRPQMEVIKAEASLESILPQITRSGHSRYPVIGDSPDDVLGILLTKDLLPQILADDAGSFDIRGLLRQTVVVPESKRLNVLLREFRENR